MTRLAEPTCRPAYDGDVVRWLLVVLVGCGRIGFEPPRQGATGSDALDVFDSPPLGAWPPPTRVFAGTPPLADDPSLTGDGLELFFNDAARVYVSKRMLVTDPWPTPVEVTALGSNLSSPHVSDDGLTIWVVVGTDVAVATRTTRNGTWSTPTVIPELVGQEDGVSISVDELVLVCDSMRSGMFEMYMSTRASPEAVWGAVMPIAEINTPGFEGRPHLSGDKLTLYFHAKPMGSSNQDLYSAHRTSVAGAFGPAASIPGVNDPVEVDEDPGVSADERHLVFASQAGGVTTLWESWR